MAGMLLAALAPAGEGAPEEQGLPGPCALSSGVRDMDSAAAASYSLPQVEMPAWRLSPFTTTVHRVARDWVGTNRVGLYKHLQGLQA